MDIKKYYFGIIIKMERDCEYICLTFKSMIYFRLITSAVIILMLVYYGMIVGQLFGFWKITNRKISFVKLCIPFYYWIVSQKN